MLKKVVLVEIDDKELLKTVSIKLVEVVKESVEVGKVEISGVVEGVNIEKELKRVFKLFIEVDVVVKGVVVNPVGIKLNSSVISGDDNSLLYILI
jgi:hypothetical protein